MAQTAKNFSPIHIRQTHIQDDHIKFMRGQQIVGSLAIVFVCNRISRLAERMK